MASKPQISPPTANQTSETSDVSLTEQQQAIVRFLVQSCLFVAGDKGGVGKSFLTSLLVSYLLSIIPKEKLFLFDCDRSNPTTKACWAKELEVSTAVSFTEDKNENFKADPLIEILAQGDSTLICDTPAQVSRGLYHALTEGALIESAEMVNAEFLVFYVCQADTECLDQFLAWLQQFNFIKQVVLVKNLCRATVNDWESLMAGKAIVSAKKRYGFVEMYLPELKKPEIDSIRQHKLSLAKALEQANLCGKTRLLRYQREIFSNLETAFLTLLEKQ